ncbi:MAG: ribbon-helix-helix protein, CopG family [Haloplanus sp.]
MSDRVTVSMDQRARSALDSLVDETGDNRSEVVRDALRFYHANRSIAASGDDNDLRKYNKALASQDHLLLDRDFMHLFLSTLAEHDALEDFLEETPQVAAYHVPEYREDFSSIVDLLDWLRFCGFLRYRQIDDEAVQLIFHNRHIKEVMSTFTVNVIEGLDYEVTVSRDGITKVVLEIPGLEDGW